MQQDKPWASCRISSLLCSTFTRTQSRGFTFTPWTHLSNPSHLSIRRYTHTHCHSFMCFYASLLTMKTDTKRLNTPDFSVFSSLSICMRTPPTCAPWRTPCCSCIRASRRTRLQYWYRVLTLYVQSS